MADNGSEDGTRACVERWSEREPRIHLVDASARQGAAAARNVGVRSARGHLLAFCDADDVVRPGWLASMLAALADTDLVAGVFDFGALHGCPSENPVPAATRQLGFLPFGLSANLGGPSRGPRGSRRFRRGLVSRRGRRLVLATPTGGAPVHSGDRCRREQARAGRWTTHVSWRLGVWQVWAPAIRALPR